MIFSSLIFFLLEAFAPDFRFLFSKIFSMHKAHVENKVYCIIHNKIFFSLLFLLFKYFEIFLSCYLFMNKMKIYKYVQNEKTQKEARVKSQSYNSFTCYVSWVGFWNRWSKERQNYLQKKIFQKRFWGCLSPRPLESATDFFILSYCFIN